MIKFYILDSENRPVEVAGAEVWAEWCESASNRIVAYTEITSAMHVSTVFLSLDHRFTGKGPPVLFETMIFGGPAELDERQWRYVSWDDAETGHKRVVALARAAIGQRVEQ